MVLPETIKWLTASLTQKKGIGFKNEHPGFSHPDGRIVAQISHHQDTLVPFHRGDSCTSRDASLMGRYRSCPQVPSLTGETWPLPPGSSLSDRGNTAPVTRSSLSDGRDTVPIPGSFLSDGGDPAPTELPVCYPRSTTLGNHYTRQEAPVLALKEL